MAIFFIYEHYQYYGKAGAAILTEILNPNVSLHLDIIRKLAHCVQNAADP